MEPYFSFVANNWKLFAIQHSKATIPELLKVIHKSWMNNVNPTVVIKREVATERKKVTKQKVIKKRKDVNIYSGKGLQNPYFIKMMGEKVAASATKKVEEETVIEEKVEEETVIEEIVEEETIEKDLYDVIAPAKRKSKLKSSFPDKKFRFSPPVKKSHYIPKDFPQCISLMDENIEDESNVIVKESKTGEDHTAGVGDSNLRTNDVDYTIDDTADKDHTKEDTAGVDQTSGATVGVDHTTGATAGAGVGGINEYIADEDVTIQFTIGAATDIKYQTSDQKLRAEQPVVVLEVNEMQSSKSGQPTWLEEDLSEVTVETSKQLEAAGMAERLTLAGWEEKASVCLTANPKLGLMEVERLVAEGESLSTAMPNLEKLTEACRKAREWWARAEALQKQENYPYLDTLEALVARGRPFPIRLDPLNQLEAKVASVKAWRDRTAWVFLKKTSHYNLLEVLSPRYEFDKDKKKKKRSNDVEVQHPIFQGQTAQEIVDAFKQAEQNELVYMRDLRDKNLAAERVEGNCILDCELCREQFLPGSVSLPRTGPHENRDRPNSLKFLCPACLRSRRPRLETIFNLLVSLRKLTVRLPEGEALQCLTNRAMDWQDRARTVLATPELSDALAKLSFSRGERGEGDQEGEASGSDGDGPSSPRKRLGGEPGLVLTLAASTIVQLEDLMMEGDLLEVSLDEVAQIWRILQVRLCRKLK